MSTQCNRFVQNAWKKELCSNCFKPREEHVCAEETLRLNIGKMSTNPKTDKHKPQSILRAKSVCQASPSGGHKKKNVAFPDSLSEIIGYGGDDFLSDDGDDDEDERLDESLNSEDDAIVPDSEEERALGNLTRANTNFNTVTANLGDAVSAANEVKSASAKSFASLMLGRIQKDADGRKTTLLVSVTPFGGDEPLPTARRPIDRKITVNGFAGTVKSKTDSAENKNEIYLKSVKKLDADGKKDDKPERQFSSPAGLEKIMDMPLITSSNLISVIQRSEIEPDLNSLSDQRSVCDFKDRKLAAISRSSPIKKPESEKPRVSVQSTNGDFDVLNRIGKTPPKSLSDGNPTEIELTFAPLTRNDCDDCAESDRSLTTRGKDVNKITVMAADAKIETSPAEAKKYSFEESRESAGEPDGKADEEEMNEPPALPRSPPPIDTRLPVQGDHSGKTIATEPRVSFLHGGSAEKPKPVVPQKPIFSAKGAALAKNVLGCEAAVGAKKVGACVPPPPPSVQNVGNRSVQGAGAAPKEQTPAARPAPSDKPADQTSSDQTLVESAPKDKDKPDPPKASLPPNKPKPPPLNLPRTASVGRELDETLEADDENPDPTSTPESRSNKRRMAPRPPGNQAENDEASAAISLFARNPGATLKSDSPVVREKEKRERASSCSPKFRKAVCEVPDPTASQHGETSRRTISLSQDSLAGQEVREEKKRGRSRFSLKRFLRMGSRKDVDMTGGSNGARIDEIPSTPQPKPRLEIIHPLELDGAAVEVVGHERVGRIGDDQVDAGGKNDARTRISSGQAATARPGKPPPPPRNQSLEDWSRLDAANKPIRPPPPRVDSSKLPARSSEKSKSATAWQPSSTPSSASDSIYANLAAEDVTGEVRSALAPSKPQRTASMRDQATSSQPILKKHGAQPHRQEYERVDGTSPGVPTSDSPTSNDSHVYECLSSSPECDSNLELRHGGGSHLPGKRKSDSSAMESGAEFKFHHQPFVRSTSLPYCGSETESELYAPYSFYTGDEGPEEDQDWKSKDDEFRLSRLRQRRGRSIVHRSLEDNYGAVVVANHEALAQFLEQVNQAPQMSMNLRGLKNTNPRLSDFNLDTSTSISIGKRIFVAATWNEQSVTLCIAFDPAMHVSRKEFYLAPILEFIDAVPKDIAEKTSPPTNKGVEATVSVLPRLQVSDMRSFGLSTRDAHDEGSTREASFVLLQFVNALKSLQARGIEEAPRNLTNVVLCREDKDACYRLYLLQGLNIDTGDERVEEKVSLCQCALIALQELYLSSRLPLVQELLMREKAVTLSQVKSVLEFSLWGPADLTLGGLRDREMTLQRWLDLERATVLHALVRTRIPLTVTDEYQLLFLVRTSAKIMSESSVLLDEQRSRLADTC